MRGKGIGVFTYAQLSFRIRGLTKILATVAMLIALSAGAISGGMAFQNNAKQTAEVYQVYDIIIMNKSTKEQSILDSITFAEEHEYRFKTDDRFVYFLKDDLENNLPLIRAGYSKRDWSQATRITEPLLIGDIPISQLIKEEGFQDLPEQWQQFIHTVQPTHRMFEGRFIVDLASYNKLMGSEERIYIGKTAEFTSYLDEWKQLEDVQYARYPDAKNIAMTSKFQYYESQFAIASGTVFMGLFLGIAFLAMMASCLMFKVLSSASKDTRRYDMLRKIGVRLALLEKSIQKELFLIFLFPALLGLAHVLVGMNLFSFILLDPYYRIWVPIMLFLIIYTVYYAVTVRMYKAIVLKAIGLTQ
jgi:putative ABC transport system permease protein